MPDRIPHRIKSSSKRKNRVYDIDSEQQATGAEPSPTSPTSSTSTGETASNSAERLWEQTSDLIRIAGRLVSRKRSGAIRAAIEKWSQTPKRERQSIMELARELGVSRQYVHRLLAKSAPLERAPSRLTETRNPESDKPQAQQKQEDDVNGSVNCALVDFEPQNMAKSTARAISRNEILIEAGKPTRFPPGMSANPGGRPRLRVLSTAYRHILDQMVPGTNQTYADAIAQGQVKAAMRGKTDAAREIADRTEGKVPRPLHISDVWYSLEIDAGEIPAAFKPVRNVLEELPAPVDGDQPADPESREG